MSTDRAQLLRTMLRIRRLEEQVVHLAQDQPGLIRFHYHVSIGQEATAAGVCAALRPDDYVFTTHRNHGHVLAKGGEPRRILAEILARVDGYCRGRAGTFHVAAPDLGILHTSAIVGGCLPLAAGAAWGVKNRRLDRATVVFFGDGTMEEGATYEALNLASVWQLPVLFLMEHNGIGRGRSGTHGAAELTDVPRSLGIPTSSVDGNDVDTVLAATSAVVDKLRAGQGPFFLESRIERWPGNAGMFPRLLGGDTDVSLAWDASAAPPGLGAWATEHDPVVTYARKLLNEGLLSQDQLVAMDRDASTEAREALRFALDSAEPDPSTAQEYVYA